MWLWQFWSTFFCLLGAVALWPVSYAEQWIWEETKSRKNWEGRGDAGESRNGDLLDGVGLQDLERKALVNEPSR